MPAYRRQKLSCASLETSPKPKRQRKPRKEMTEEEKEEAELLRLERKVKKEAKARWEASLPQPWVPVRDFCWPAGTLGMYKSDAERTYDLTDKDLSTLRYESIQGSPKTFFSHRHVKQLALR
ncbi:hypothetical protein M0805_002634 [Coniferiporia weirii]|nr:hypothetical protein M0805_002634 [Coniferiporia weirii]